MLVAIGVSIGINMLGAWNDYRFALRMSRNHLDQRELHIEL